MAATKTITITSTSAPSTKSLADIKAIVAAPVGAKDNPDEVRALDAIHMAIDWLMEWEWEWFILDNLTFTTTSGTPNYAITPTAGGIRTLKGVRVSVGTQRPLVEINEQLYNRQVHDQTATGLPGYYSLNRWGQALNMKLHPTPSSTETIQYDCYFEPSKETDPSKALLLPTWLESPLILRAQALVTEWRGGNPERLLALSEASRYGMAARDRAPRDREVRFHSFDEHATIKPNLDQAPSYYDRFE